MDTPVQDIIVGNIPGARGSDTDIKPRDVKYTSQCIVDTPLSTDKQSVETVPETDCLAECAHLTITFSHIERDIGRKSSFSHSPLAFDTPIKGVPNFPVTYNGGLDPLVAMTSILF